MLAPRWMTAAGIGLAVLGVFSYAFIPAHRWEALAIGVGLGAAVVIAGHVAGGPRPVPQGGYGFEGAMAVLHRASIGGIVVAATLTGFGFVLWMRGLGGDGLAGGAIVLGLFGLGLLVLYASVLAAVGLVHVASITGGSDPDAGGPAGERSGEDDGQDAPT